MYSSPISGFAPINGITMYYEIYGEGDIPLVLIHGGGSTIGSSFGRFLPYMSDYGKIIAIELQAHGRTSDRDAPESFEQDADDVAALLKHLEIPKANFLGFSNGGTTTLQMAIRHAALVNKIVVVSGAWKREGFIPGFFEGMEQVQFKDMPYELKRAYRIVNKNYQGLQTMFEKDKQRMIAFRDGHDEDLKQIAAPALLMVADKDVISIEHTAELSRLIPDARLAVLPGSHGSFIGELCTVDHESNAISVAAGIIKEFLSDLRQVRRRINEIMHMDYDRGDLWCKVLQLRDFDESYLTGAYEDPSHREDNAEQIAVVHNYMKDRHKPEYRQAFLLHFFEALSIDHTPESMSIGALNEDTWTEAEGESLDAWFEKIIGESVAGLGRHWFGTAEELLAEKTAARKRFADLKNKFLDVFAQDVVFLVNRHLPGEDAPEIPAVIAMDNRSTGIYFLGL